MTQSEVNMPRGLNGPILMPTDGTSRSFPIRPRLAQPKEHPFAPNPECRRVLDPFLGPEINEIVEHRPREPRLETVAHQNIGYRPAARSGVHPQWVVGSRRHKFVEIGAEDQSLGPAFAHRRQRHREEGDVLDLDAAALRRRDEPIATIRLAAEDGTEELDEGLTANGRSTIKPGAVAGDAHLKIATIDRRPPSPCRRARRRGIAGTGVFSQVYAWRRL